MGKGQYRDEEGSKKRKLQQRDETSEDEDIVSGHDASEMSYDSEEEAMKKADEAKNSRKVGKVQDRESTKNKLKLGQFHRNATFKKKNRKVCFVQGIPRKRSVRFVFSKEFQEKASEGATNREHRENREICTPPEPASGGKRF